MNRNTETEFIKHTCGWNSRIAEYNFNRDVFEDNMVEAKAKAKATKFCPRGRGQSSKTPIPGLF